MTGRRERCHWDEDMDGNWDTACGQGMCFDEGGPVDNHFAFCPFCGGHLSLAPYREPDPITEDEDL